MPKKTHSPEIDWPHIARLVLTSRLMDYLEENEFVPQGKIKYQFSAKGHELAQVLLAQHLTHPHDGATVYYRSRPFMLASGLDLQEAFAAGFAKTGSPSEGRDVGVVFSMQPRPSTAASASSASAQDRLTVLPSSGAVGAQYTPAWRYCACVPSSCS